MTWADYNNYFDEILTNPAPSAPYDNADYMDYTKMNHKRTSRWLKHGELLPEIKEVTAKISENQHWVLITEPWCGDAAHIVPFIQMISELSEKVELEIQLRDAGSEIDKYLTNGGRAIPILVIRDAEGKDLGVWGPRPAECQKIFLQMKADNADFETQKITLQNWYNKDNGVSLQRELTDLISKTIQ